MSTLVEVADKEAKLFALEFREAKAQRLLNFLITENGYLMVLRGIQIRYAEAVFVWPQDGLLLVYLDRKVSRMAHKLVGRRSDRLTQKNWRNANGATLKLGTADRA